MTRTTRYKVAYAALLMGGLAAAGVVLFIVPNPVLVGLVLAAVLLVPGRVHAVLWRDLFRGRRLLESGQPEEAIRHFESFLERLRKRPALKTAIWLSWGIYTRNAEAMTLNNLGVAKIAVGRLDEAETHFKEALRIDPLYPLPYAGLADVALRRKDDSGARSNAERAIALGHGETTADKLLQSLSSAYTNLQSRL